MSYDNYKSQLPPSEWSDTDLNVIWMLRRHMNEIYKIEEECYGLYGWNEQEFMSNLRNKDCIGMVAQDTQNGDVLGYIIYNLYPKKLEILTMGVAPRYQRLGVATALIAFMITKLSQQRRTNIVIDVRESNLIGQLFLKSQGFKCKRVLKEWYDNIEDGYRMVYSLKRGDK